MGTTVLGGIAIAILIIGIGYVESNAGLSLICVLAFGALMKVAVREWEKEK